MKKVLFLLLFYSFQIHPFLIIGHRGACGYKPENTLSSFQLAVDMGVNMIELDVYVCKTGELVVHHDDSVDRTTNGHGNVVDLSFTELRNLKIDGDEQIPTLSEVIDLVDRRVPINIELKGPGTAEPVARLIQQYLKNGWSEHDFVTSSFDHEQIQQFKKLCPNVKIGVLFSKKLKNIVAVKLQGWIPENWLQFLFGIDSAKIILIAQKFQANFVGVDVVMVTRKIVKDIHSAGFLVYVWTVNDKVTADAMRAFGVDGIFANYPDRV